MESAQDQEAQVVAVVGASGFVGKEVSQRLTERGALVRNVTAPRISYAPGQISPDKRDTHITDYLRDCFADCFAVVNAAGVADASAADANSIWGANAILPGAIAAAARSAGARTVHVSSAAVQGRKATLDASELVSGFSMYSQSKIAGEIAIRTEDPEAVIYRPPGVHGAGRQVTNAVCQLARSALSTVASPGEDNAPQAQITNVADAIAFLATTARPIPKIVTHPTEGITTSKLLEMLGGRPPKLLPRRLAKATVFSAFALAGFFPSLMGHARRLEVLWFGQAQAPSWLTEAGWSPVIGQAGWYAIGEASAPSSLRT